MKKITHPIFVLAFGSIAAAAFAQAPNTETNATTTTTKTTVAEASKLNAATASVVGVSSRDGITMSGADVFVTRNGVTEKLIKELELSNGVRVLPGGEMVTKDGVKTTLRPSQILGFDGKIIHDPINESVAPKTSPAPAAQSPAQTGESAAEEARVNAERRAKAANKGPIKAGEGVQK